jgi:hypothetical protein
MGVGGRRAGLLAVYVPIAVDDRPQSCGTNLEVRVKALLLVVAWCILFALAWPLALLALALFPLVWLLSLPFRLIGITVGAMFALLKAILFLPARLLGHRG